MKMKTKAKKCIIKRKFEDYKSCLEVAQHENKIKHKKKRIVKNSLKTRQRFKSKSIMVLLKKKIALSSNGDKQMQSTDLIEKYAYGTRKDLVS